MKSTIMSDFYKQLDELYFGIEKFLNNYSKSTILQNYFMKMFESFFYATIINNFFTNLNKEIVKELKLPRGKIGQIKSEFKLLRKDLKSALSFSSKNKNIDDEYYENLKIRIEKEFPEFQKITQEIEKVIELEKANDYMKKIEENIKKLEKPDANLDDFIIITILESFVQRGKDLPIGKEPNKLIKGLIKEIVPEFSKKIMKTLYTTSNKMLDSQRKIQKGFENRLYKRWKKPLELFECYIKVSLKCGEQQRIKLNKITNDKNRSIHEALIKIHARSLQISNEILVLLRTGYADGANSRWRSLHELAVISFFLHENNNNEISRRYLEHEIVRAFKEAEDYRVYCKKLGYAPISKKEFNKIKREKEKICRKYGDRFQDDYGWIPSSILPNRNFRALEEYVNLSKFRPFYNLSCDSVHGGAKGFYRLGIMHEYQNRVLLVGPSNYGLADPIQNTAISLSHITVCLLSLKPDFENIIQMNVILSYVNDIGTKAVDIQKSIENEEQMKSAV